MYFSRVPAVLGVDLEEYHSRKGKHTEERKEKTKRDDNRKHQRRVGKRGTGGVRLLVIVSGGFSAARLFGFSEGPVCGEHR